MDHTACTEPQCMYSTAKPLLPLWAVRPVQSLSACTRGTFTFTFYLDSKKSVLFAICRLVQCINVTSRKYSSNEMGRADRREHENSINAIVRKLIKAVRYRLSVCYEGVWGLGGKHQHIPTVHHTEKELHAWAV